MQASLPFGAPVLALGPTQMSGNMLLLGLLGLGAILFVLQRLRVRHRSRLVVTTLFWREALEESRARTLFERFRHPLTYLLLALIGGLLWLSVARIEGERSDGLSHVFLLDASATMGVGDRFDRAVDALAEALEEAPRERTEVLLCGETVEALLVPGEDRALLRERLRDAKPAGVPASIERALVSSARVMRREGSERRRFVVVGDGSVGEAAGAMLPEGDWVERLDIGAEEVPGNLGITALGLAPAKSGDFDALDAFIEVRGPGASSADVSILLGGSPVLVSKRRATSPGVLQLVCRDLRTPSQGAGGSVSRLTVALPGAADDALPLDNYAEVLLPDLRLIRALVVPTGDPAVDSALRAACMADSAIEVVASAARADVAVGGAAPEQVGPLPSLRVSTSADQEHAIEVFEPAVTDADALLARVLGELGLDRVDGARLASELGRPLSLGSTSGGASVRSVSLWSELFDPALCSFTESRSFPLVVGRTARWLAGAPEIVPYVASGRPRPSRLADSSNGTSFPWDVSAVPTQASSPLDVESTVRAGALAQAIPLDSGRASNGGGSGPWRLTTWLLAIVLVALLVEWVLYQRGRIA